MHRHAISPVAVVVRHPTITGHRSLLVTLRREVCVASARNFPSRNCRSSSDNHRSPFITRYIPPRSLRCIDTQFHRSQLSFVIRQSPVTVHYSLRCAAKFTLHRRAIPRAQLSFVIRQSSVTVHHSLHSAAKFALHRRAIPRGAVVVRHPTITGHRSPFITRYIPPRSLHNTTAQFPRRSCRSLSDNHQSPFITRYAMPRSQRRLRQQSRASTAQSAIPFYANVVCAAAVYLSDVAKL